MVYGADDVLSEHGAGGVNHLDLFSGIGGFALAAQTVWGEDYHCVGFCEIDPFCQQVLSKKLSGSANLWRHQNSIG